MLRESALICAFVFSGPLSSERERLVVVSGRELSRKLGYEDCTFH